MMSFSIAVGAVSVIFVVMVILLIIGDDFR
jgi:hypothetical protein